MRLQGVGVKHDGKRAVVDQGYFHHGSEYAGFDVLDVLPRAAYERLVEVESYIWLACFAKRGAIAALAVSVERELGYHEHGAFYVGDREVGFAAFVLEDAHLVDLVPEALYLLLGVALADAEQDEISRPDRADGAFLYGDASLRDTLNDCAHGVPLSLVRLFACFREDIIAYGRTIWLSVA